MLRSFRKSLKHRKVNFEEISEKFENSDENCKKIGKLLAFRGGYEKFLKCNKKF